MSDPVKVSDLRTFGLVVGGIFLVIALWPLVVRGESARLWAAVLSATLVALGLLAPARLRLPHRAWSTIGEILGWINLRIVMGIVFFGLFTPIGWIRRALGRDALGLTYDPDSPTYRTARQARPVTHMKRQF